MWLGQASMALRFGGATVLVDPFLSDYPDRLVPAPFTPEEARGVDAVLITHDHVDHLDEEALPVIAASSPEAVFVVPDELVERTGAVGIERSRVVGLGPDEHADVGSLSVDAVPACHGDSTDDAYRLGPFRGYVVGAGGARVYHAGDTIPFDGLGERVRELNADLALLPINGRDAEREAQGLVGNLDAREAAEVAAEAGVDAAVPIHWDMFAANPGDPGAFVAAAQMTVIVLRHNRPFVYSAPGSAS
jgi:L-ascorbate metabolism protein UlaG (beta-lactamase superfamily)